MATIPNTPDHLDLGIRFVQALETTRVRKVARLVADTASRDWQMRQLTGEEGISYQFQTFVRQEVALAWLKA
ncbi:hypothetical protein [Pontibacter populi]|uniref:Uncharacterized protein n=1 Tax=Pontibacter populi TaxID=890055 RepID=A0ABV1RXY2_9BACT